MISIVIPVKNGGETIKECLQGIFNQTLADQLEVIVIDSGSEDNTLEILKEFPVRLKQIPQTQFNHGATRNLGVQIANGKYIVMTVQDSMAADNLWLAKMIKHFDDPEVAGVCGQQIVPHDRDKNPHEWFRPVNSPTTKIYQFKNISEFDSLTPKKKRWVCGWDDVNACYRAEILKHILPFNEVVFGEDLDWANRAYKHGYKLVFDTHSRVYHYHHNSYERHYERRLIELHVDYDYFGIKPTADFPLIKFLKIIYRNFKYRVSLFWIVYNWKLLLAEWNAKRAFNKSLHKVCG
jgi:rhamnosyltransferase